MNKAIFVKITVYMRNCFNYLFLYTIKFGALNNRGVLADKF